MKDSSSELACGKGLGFIGAKKLVLSGLWY